MMSAAVHDAGLPPASATILPKTERLTKDRAKALVGAGLHRAVTAHGKDQVRLAGGCSRKSVDLALSHTNLTSLDVLLNMLDLDPTILDEVLAVRGKKLVPLDAAPSADLMLSAGLAGVAAALCAALADGKRDHVETLDIAKQLRPLMPALASFIAEADQIRVGG